MKIGLLASVSLLVLIGSSSLVRADDFDTIASQVQAAEQNASTEGVTADTKKQVDAVNKEITEIKDAKMAAATAQSDLTAAQKVLNGANPATAAADYQAQANKLAVQMDVVDNLNKLAQSATFTNIKATLDDAVAKQTTAEYWVSQAKQAVDKANDPTQITTAQFKKDAADGYANALNKLAIAQKVEDAAVAAAKDPKNGVAAFQAKLQQATNDLADMKTKLDDLNSKKIAVTAAATAKSNLDTANAIVTAKTADVIAKGFNAVNAYYTDKDNFAKQKAAAPAVPPALASGAAGTPATGGTTVPIVVNPGAPLIGNAGGALIGNAGGALVGNSSGTVISNDGGSAIPKTTIPALIGSDSVGLIGSDSAGLLKNGAPIVNENGAGLTKNAAAPIISDNSEGLRGQTTGMLAGLSAAAAAGVTASNPLKQDSTISAFSNVTIQSPTEQLQAGIAKNLSGADQKVLNGLIADVKAGKTLSDADVTKAQTLLNQAAKGLDTKTVQNLQTAATSKAAAAGVTTTLPATAVQNAVAMAAVKDPSLAAVAQKIAAGQALSASEVSQVNKVVAAVTPVSTAAAPAATTTAATTPATSTATPAATSSATSTTPAMPVIDAAAQAKLASNVTGVDAAGLQQLVNTSPQVIAAFDKMIAAETDPAKKALLTQDRTNVDTQMKAAAATLAALPASATSTAAASATPAATTTPAAATPAATTAATAPVAVASTAPSATANAATSTSTTTTPAAVATATAAKTDEAAEPAKLTSDQAKNIHQALRTIPGNLSKSDEKTFSALSSLVDKAASGKGLSADEAATLKAGISALADKHPKAEKQLRLTSIANTVQTKSAVAKSPSGSANPVASATPGSGTSPSMKREEVMLEKKPAVAITTPAKRTEPVVKHEVTIPEKKPAVAISTPPGNKIEAVKPHEATHSEPKMQAPLQPKPALASAPKAPPPPAARAPTCTPNMVGGKMMGMVCH